MSDSARALAEICRQAHNGGVPKAQLQDLVGKIKAKIVGDAAKTKDGVCGPIYELVTSIKLLDKGHAIKDPTNVGDSFYRKGGQDRVRQLKWATGNSKSVLTKNLSHALSQLSGTVADNPEFAPAKSMAIADIVLTSPPQSIIDTFATEQGMQTYVTQMVVSALDREQSKLGATSKVSVRVTMLQAAGQSTKYCVDFTATTVTVRAPSTKSRDAIVLAEGLIALFADDVKAGKRDEVKQEVAALFKALPSW